jgi:hypothetical protein
MSNRPTPSDAMPRRSTRVGGGRASPWFLVLSVVWNTTLIGARVSLTSPTHAPCRCVLSKLAMARDARVSNVGVRPSRPSVVPLIQLYVKPRKLQLVALDPSAWHSMKDAASCEM